MNYRAWCWGTLALLVIGSGCRPTRVQGPSMGMEPSDVIIVTGLGEAHGPPDVATLSVGVQRRSPDVKQAISEANQTLASVLAALTASGVSAADIRTSQINVGLEELPPSPYPMPMPLAEPAPAPVAPPPPAKEPPARGKAARPGAQAEAPPAEPAPAPAPPAPPTPAHTYHVSLTVTAKIRQVSRAGEAMAAAFMAGANQAYGLQLGWEDPTLWLDKARRDAMTDARHRVDEIAQLGGLKVSHVLSVLEQNCGASTGPVFGSPYAMMGPMPMMAAKMPDMPFEGGEVTASCVVRAAYAIEK